MVILRWQIYRLMSWMTEALALKQGSTFIMMINLGFYRVGTHAFHEVTQKSRYKRQLQPDSRAIVLVSLCMLSIRRLHVSTGMWSGLIPAMHHSLSCCFFLSAASVNAKTWSLTPPYPFLSLHYNCGWNETHPATQYGNMCFSILK